MDTKSEGHLARLPDGQRVRIESCEGDSATVRRVDGDRAGTLAVCALDKLEPDEETA